MINMKPSPAQIDVLFVNPGAVAKVYQGLSHEFSAIEPPTSAALFATYLRQKNYQVDILDAAALNLGTDEVAQVVTSGYIAKLVVFVVYGFQPSASTQNMPAAQDAARAIKAINPAQKILMTGTHPSALPMQTYEEGGVDYVCSGEGPETILGVIEHLKTNTSLLHVPSLIYEMDGKMLANPSQGLMEDIDEQMPMPAFDLLPMERYRAHNWHCFDHINDRQPYASIHTSLGCPYKCSFCCINAPFGKSSYRMWSPEVVLKQIDELVLKYGVKNIKFIDEMFVLNKDHVLGICDGLIERNYDLNIWAYARVDTVKPIFLEKLRKAGVRWLALGIESGSKHVRDGVSKGRFGYEEIVKVVKQIQEAGIYVIGNYIFGLPDDTFETMEETLQLALETNCEFSNFYSAMAYPGSQLYKMAIERNWDLPKTWLGYSQHAYEALPLRTDVLTAAEVLQFRDEAFVRFFSSDSYQDMLREKFGQEVVEHIKHMLTVTLERELYSQRKVA